MGHHSYIVVNIFVFDDNDSLVDSLTQGTSAKDRYEKRDPPPDSQAHYPSGLGYRSVLLQEMIQADRDGDENLALIRLAELEAYYHAEKYESPWWKFLYLISWP